MIAGSILKMFGRNAVLAGVVFLPVFMAGVEVTSMIRGFPFAPAGAAHAAAGAVMLYLGMSVPVVVGVLAHSAVLAVLLLLRVHGGRRLQIAALALAPVVPVTPLALGVLGGVVFTDEIGPTAVATLAYGIAVARWAVKAPPGG